MEDAQVDQGGQGDRGPAEAAPVVVDGLLVVAVEVVDVGQLEQGAGVVAVQLDGLLELLGGGLAARRRRPGSCRAGSGTRPRSRRGPPGPAS